MPEHEKLVRDGIPKLIEADGRKAAVRVASPEEYGELLRKKLVEEVQEFLDTNEHEELADILEVLLALAQDAGISVAELERLRARKAAKRGRFTKRFVWRPTQAEPSDSQ